LSENEKRQRAADRRIERAERRKLFLGEAPGGKSRRETAIDRRQKRRIRKGDK